MKILNDHVERRTGSDAESGNQKVGRRAFGPAWSTFKLEQRSKFKVSRFHGLIRNLTELKSQPEVLLFRASAGENFPPNYADHGDLFSLHQEFERWRLCGLNAASEGSRFNTSVHKDHSGTVRCFL